MSVNNNNATGTDSPAPRSPKDLQSQLRGSEKRISLDHIFRKACVAIAAVSVVILLFLLGSIITQGVPSLSITLLTGTPEPDAEQAGAWPAIAGTIWVCSICALITLPIGIGTAVLLEEFKPRNRWTIKVFSVIQVNISNLAGVPSVVYGILGLTAFVSMFGLFDGP